MPRTGVSIATICVHDPGSLSARTALAARLIERINKEWRPPDCILLPGGYFSIAGSYCNKSFHERCSSLAESALANHLKGILSFVARDQLLVVGVDTDSKKEKSSDQMCVAWNGEGNVVGIGRKAFPTKGDAGGKYVVSYEDFSSADRVVRLRSGHAAVLLSCYDIFGVSEDAQGRAPKGARKSSGVAADSSGKRPSRADGAAAFSYLLQSTKTRIALAAIHGFEEGTSMFQRHGIATASAAMAGGLAVGAAHFHDALPSSANVSTLAAHSVSASELRLTDSRYRKAHALQPRESFIEGEVAMVRNFWVRV